MATTEVGIRISAKDDTAGAFGSINAGLGKLQSTATSVRGSLAALGIGLSAGAFVAFTKNIINGIDALNDLKDATGASIENLSALEDIARRTGTSFDTVGSALVKLNQALSNAKPGSDTERAISAIGLSVKDLKALDPAEAFRQIAVSLNGFADDANKARLTQELFGKSLKEVAPLLKDVAEQGKLVGTVTAEQAAEAEKFNKELFALEKTVTDLSRSLVSKMLPSLNALAVEMAAAKKTSSGFWDGFITQALQNPFKSAGENAEVYRKELDELTAARQRYLKSGSDTLAIDQAIATMQRRLAYFTELEGNATAKAAAGGGRGSVNPAFVLPSVADLGELSASAAAAKKAGDDAAKAAEAQAKAYKSLVAGISEKIAANNLEAQSGEKLTEAQKEELAIRKLVEQGTISQADANGKNTKELLAQLAASENLAEQAIKTAQQMAKGSADYAKYLEQQDQSLEKVREDIKQEEQRIAQMGLTQVALAELMALQMEDDAALLERNAARATGLGLQGEETRLMLERADALRQLAALRREGAVKEAGVESAKTAADEWKRAAEQIESSITDALLRGFESGKPFAQNLRDTIENMFKTLVLRPIVQATVQGALGLDGGPGAGGGLGNIANTFASLSKAADTFSFALTDFKTFATYGAQDIGAALTKAGFKDAGGAVSGNASAIGSGINTAAVGLSYLEAVSNFKDGTYGQSIGQAIGTAWAGPIGGQIGKALGGIADRIFGGDQGPTAVGVNSSFDAQGNLTGRVKNAATSNDAVNQFTSLLAVGYQQALAKFGATGKASTFRYQTTSDGFFDVATNIEGSDKFTQGRTAYTPEALQLASSRAIFAALQASELPGYLSTAFDGIVANTASAEQIAGAYQFADSLKAVRFSLLSASEQQAEYQKVIDAGNATLGTSAATFKTDFIDAIDKGLTPETLAQWQALGGTMQALEQIVGSTNTALRSAADIANERKSLQDKLDAATLTSAQMLDKQRTALDASNQALFDQVTAAEAAKAATENFNSAMSNLAGTRFDLENQLLTLQGQGAQVLSRNRERDIADLTAGVTDPLKIKDITERYDYNQSLRDQIAATEAAQQAAQQYAQAQAQASQDAARAAEQSAQEAARAAEQFKAAWQAVTDSIFDEVKRIRGLLGTPQQSYAQAQAQFSITAAQAAAGDQNAAKALPELSRVLLTLAEAQATSLVELQTIRGSTAGTLESIAQQLASQYGLQVPMLSTGTNFVPKDMLAVVHKGEAVVPAAYNPSNGGGGGNDALVAEVQALRQEMAAMRATNEAIAKATANSDKTLTRVTRGGDNMVTKDYTVA